MKTALLCQKSKKSRKYLAHCKRVFNFAEPIGHFLWYHFSACSCNFCPAVSAGRTWKDLFNLILIIMKKLYTLALAAAVALSASALSLQQVTPNEGFRLMPKGVNTAERLVKPTETRTFITPRKAVSADDFYGLYVWSYTDARQGETYEEQEFYVDPYEVQGEVQEGVALIEFDGWQTLAKADLEAGTLTFVTCKIAENLALDATTNVDVYVLPFYIDDDPEVAIEDMFVISEGSTITITDNSVTMPENQGWGVYLTLAGKDLSAPDTQIIPYALYAYNEFEPYDDLKYWTPVGEGEYRDGLTYSIYRKEGETASEENVPVCNVEVYRNVENPNFIRVMNPFGPYMKQFYTSGEFESNPVYLDLTDPTDVIWELQFTGIVDSDGQIYFMGGTYAIEAFGLTEAEIVEWGIKNITYADNVISFPQGSVLLAIPRGGNNWGIGNKLPAYNTYLSLPEDWNSAVSDITVEGTDAPVEYYNLQGVRVANPENGLYIKRQGKTAKKVLVK